MQRISTFFYGIGQGIKNIFRNRNFSLASIGTIAASLFLFGVFYIVFTNFKFMVNSAQTNVGITVFFDEGITQEEIDGLRSTISRRAEVYRIEYTSAEQAWEEYRATKLSPELAETFGDDNPLENSASFTVYLNDVAMQDTFVRYVRGLEGVRKCNSSKAAADFFAGFNRVLTIVMAVLFTILLMVAVFLIGITVSNGISVREQEISIMKLIGATDYFIRIPYVVEGVLIGIVGAAIPLAVLRLVYTRIISVLEEKLSTAFSTMSFVECAEVMKTLVPVSLLIGIGIGFIGSRLTLKRRLKKIEVD